MTANPRVSQLVLLTVRKAGRKPGRHERCLREGTTGNESTGHQGVRETVSKGYKGTRKRQRA